MWHFSPFHSVKCTVACIEPFYWKLGNLGKVWTPNLWGQGRDILIILKPRTPLLAPLFHFFYYYSFWCQLLVINYGNKSLLRIIAKNVTLMLNEIWLSKLKIFHTIFHRLFSDFFPSKKVAKDQEMASKWLIIRVTYVYWKGQTLPQLFMQLFIRALNNDFSRPTSYGAESH